MHFIFEAHTKNCQKSNPRHISPCMTARSIKIICTPFFYFLGMFDKDRSGHINVEEFEKLYTYVNQWLTVFKTYDTDQSGSIEEKELSNGKLMHVLIPQGKLSRHN